MITSLVSFKNIFFGQSTTKQRQKCMAVHIVIWDNMPRKDFWCQTFFPHTCPYTWRIFYSQRRYLNSVILHKSFPGQQQYIWISYLLAGWYCCLSFLILSITGKSSLMVSESSPNMKYVWPDKGSPYTKKTILLGTANVGAVPSLSALQISPEHL